MPDMTITNTTNNPYTFGPYQLAAGNGQQVTIDTTTNASLYLTQDSFADIVNSLYVLGYVTVTNPPTPFPRATGVPQLLHGDGSPEGVVFATQGSAFMRRDNSGAGNALYAKTTGLSLATGWQAFSGSAPPTPGTTLPGSPSNGQQAILVDSTSAPTYAWLMQYSSAATKWICIGGTPLYNVNNTSNTLAVQASYTALPSGTPTVTIPRTGVYDVTITAELGGGTTSIAPKFGAATPSDNDRIFANQSTGLGVTGQRTLYGRSLNTSDTITLQYKEANSGWTVSTMSISVMPVTIT